MSLRAPIHKRPNQSTIGAVQLELKKTDRTARKPPAIKLTLTRRELMGILPVRG